MRRCLKSAHHGSKKRARFGANKGTKSRHFAGQSVNSAAAAAPNALPQGIRAAPPASIQIRSDRRGVIDQRAQDVLATLVGLFAQLVDAIEESLQRSGATGPLV